MNRRQQIRLTPEEQADLFLKERKAALATLARGEAAQTGLRAWIDRYDLECMRCAE